MLLVLYLSKCYRVYVYVLWIIIGPCTHTRADQKKFGYLIELNFAWQHSGNAFYLNNCIFCVSLFHRFCQALRCVSLSIIWIGGRQPLDCGSCDDPSRHNARFVSNSAIKNSNLNADLELRLFRHVEYSVKEFYRNCLISLIDL